MPTRGFLTAERQTDRVWWESCCFSRPSLGSPAASLPQHSFHQKQVAEFSPQSRDRSASLEGRSAKGFRCALKSQPFIKNPATYPLLSQYIEEEVEAQSTFVICRRNSFTLKWRKSSAFRQLIEKRRPTQEGISSRGKPSGAPLSGEPQSCLQGAPV